MNISTVMVKKLVSFIKADEFYENVTVTAAYDNDIKPYPVTKPIMAISVDHIVVGDRQEAIAEDGKRSVSNQRQIDATFKFSIFVPYESGAEECFKLFDRLFTVFLFNGDFGVVGGRCSGCKYVRDCSALQVDAQYTLRIMEDC